MTSRPTPLSPDARLYAIVDLGYVAGDRAVAAAQALLDGGAGILQLRAKNRPAAVIRGLAEQILPLCRCAGIPFIINDHVDLAAETGADGVHLGQDDGDLAAARAVLPVGALVGRSTHSPGQAEAAARDGADYIGFGPLFTTPTKPGRPAIGLGDIAAVHQRLSIPIFCIGGVNPHTLPEIVAAGARRVVVVSALLQAPDPAATARHLLATLPQA